MTMAATYDFPAFSPDKVAINISHQWAWPFAVDPERISNYAVWVELEGWL